MNVPSRVMLVDDEAHMRMYTRLILEALGVTEIMEYPRGQEALVAFRDNPPDLVIMDINMPGMTGVEILKEMSEINDEVPVVMLTSQASREIVESCRDAGASYFIRKDTPRNEIKSILQSLFEELYED